LLTILGIYRNSSATQDLQPLHSNLFLPHDEQIGLHLFHFGAPETLQIPPRWRLLNVHTQLRIMAVNVPALGEALRVGMASAGSIMTPRSTCFEGKRQMGHWLLAMMERPYNGLARHRHLNMLCFPLQ
jgi:hypothetical protein